MGSYDDNVPLALMMTLLGGLSTAIGGIFILFLKKPSFTLLGHMLSFSAGVMIYISFMDLLPESVESIGFFHANLWFFSGMLIFAVVLKFIPDVEGHGHSHGDKKEKKSQIKDKKDSTTSESSESKNDKDSKQVGKVTKRSADNAEKEKLEKEKSKDKEEEKEEESTHNGHDEGFLKKLGIATAVGISLHNFPEGVAVYLASLKGVEVGLPLMVAIAAHNIPEGMAVASPIYSSTGSKWTAFKYCLYSGLCEPLGALIFGLIFREFMTPYLIQSMLAAVAGIMVMVAIKELIPGSFKYIDSSPAVVSNIIGMIFISASIHFLHSILPHGDGSHGHSHGGHDSLPTKHIHLQGGSINDFSNLDLETINKQAAHGHSHGGGSHHGHSHGGHGHSHGGHGHSHGGGGHHGHSH